MKSNNSVTQDQMFAGVILWTSSRPPICPVTGDYVRSLDYAVRRKKNSLREISLSIVEEHMIVFRMSP